ncbi:MAG TPA: hypothetical protein V6D17_10530 [Candidatus Obscuribacterales bacterium]
MTQKPMKGGEFVKAISDLIILTLMLGAAGFGGYFWGIHQRLAPIQLVPPGTVGALLPQQVTPSPATATAPSPAAEPAQAASSNDAKSSKQAEDDPPAESSRRKGGRVKYWVSSSGTSYIGYNITVKVNNEAVDSFFGPGKNVDVTDNVKRGDNTIEFEAKALEDGYNKHSGDRKAVLTLKLVSGPSVREDYKPSDVLVTYKRAATDSGDFDDTEHFTGE